MKANYRNAILTAAILFTAGMPAVAGSRTEAECREIASQQAAGRMMKPGNATITLAATSKSFSAAADARESYYIYNLGEKGFAIISADDEQSPVLAYSSTASFPTDTASMPANLLWWLKAQEEASRSGNTESTEIQPLASLTPRKSVEAVEVSPILGEIAWDQAAPYNTLCPGESMTGCAATAMAMIMKHYNYPRVGRGNHAYVSGLMGYNVGYDFEEKPFDWSNMLPRYEEGQYTEENSAAVSELMKACGVSIDMDYTRTTSSANALKVSEAFVNYFKYNDNTLFRLRSAYTNDEWKQMLNEELAAGRPVLYNGTSKEIGHEFVIDGADASGLYHVNWGWSGNCDGYFDISLLDPKNPGIGGGTSAGGGYIRNQGMVTRIKPEKDSTEEYSHNWYMNSLILINELDNKGSIAATDEIGIGAYTFANYGPTFNGEAALVIAKELDDEPVVITGKQSMMQVGPGYGNNVQFVGKIPEDLEEGRYYLYIAAKPYKGGSWERVKSIQGYDSYLRVSYRNGRLTFGSAGKQQKLQGSIEVNNELAINSYGNFTVTAKNTGTDYYYGYVGVMITPSVNSDKYAMYYDEMRLDPGEEKTIELSRALLSNDSFYLEEGQSLICGIYTYGNSVYPLTNFQPVEIGYTKAPKLRLTEELQFKEEFKSGEELVFPFSVDCEGDYNYQLVAGIFPWGTYQTTITLTTPLDLKDGEHLDSEIRGFVEPALAEGKYLVALLAYNMTTGQYDAELGHTAIEIKGISDVDEIETNDEGKVKYFNLMGREVTNPHKGDILIRVDRLGTKKVVF